MEFNQLFFNKEIPFCRVYSLESKNELEKLLLRNRISYFIEWENNSFYNRLFRRHGKEKNVFTIYINSAEKEKACSLAQGLQDVELNES